MIRLYFLLITAFIFTACSQAAVQEGHPVIQAYSNAYIAKDIDTMRSLMHSDIEWLNIKDNEIEVHLSGKESLTKEMENWFANPQQIEETQRDWSVSGNNIAVTEVATWTTNKGKKRSQSALTVYQLEDGLIRRVYYYPSVND